MKVKIYPSRAHGEVKAPPSKSMAHRLLIAAALCEGESIIDGISSCEDVLATIDCLRALGARIEYDGDRARVFGTDMNKASPTGVLYARESGSTLRFLIPIALLSGKECEFCGSQKLLSRPQDIYLSLSREKGFYFESSATSIKLRGPLPSGNYSVPGNISSQFITGLLFALAAKADEAVIKITDHLESGSYIELTRSALSKFGICVEWKDERCLYMSGDQRPSPANCRVEGDYSGAAFLEALDLFSGGVCVSGLEEESLQGDRAYKALFPLLRDGTPTVSIEDCPDLGPILFTVAAAMNGAEFTGTGRLKIKESDRAEAMAKELKKFGAELIVRENSVTVKKAPLHPPTEPLRGHNDHRIVMSLAVLCTLYGGEIEGCEAVKKSYPDFFYDIQKLGIKAEFS